MIDLYKYIYEGILKGQDDTLATGKNDVERIMIEDWLFASRVICFNQF